MLGAKSFLWGSVSLALLARRPAAAADISVAAPRKTHGPYHDWTGFYFGGHVGYSRGNAQVTVADPDPSNFSKSFGSLSGGVQFGYNRVLPSRFLARHRGRHIVLKRSRCG